MLVLFYYSGRSLTQFFDDNFLLWSIKTAMGTATHNSAQKKRNHENLWFWMSTVICYTRSTQAEKYFLENKSMHCTCVCDLQLVQQKSWRKCCRNGWRRGWKTENEIIEIKTILNITHGATRTHTTLIPATSSRRHPNADAKLPSALCTWTICSLYSTIFIFFGLPLFPLHSWAFYVFFRNKMSHFIRVDKTLFRSGRANRRKTEFTSSNVANIV